MSATRRRSPDKIRALLASKPAEGLAALALYMRDVAGSPGAWRPEVQRAMADVLDAAVPAGQWSFPNVEPLWRAAMRIANAYLEGL